MEYIVVILLVGAAALYVGRTFYKQFTGKGSCSGGCSCNTDVKQHCESDHSSLDNITFK